MCLLLPLYHEDISYRRQRTRCYGSVHRTPVHPCNDHGLLHVSNTVPILTQVVERMNMVCCG